MKNSRQPSTIYDLLALIQKRPALYVGENNLTYLTHFLAGWSTYADIHCKSSYHIEKPNPPFRYFLNYIYMHYDLRNSDGWWHLILHHCKNNEVAALNLFFNELNKFVTCRPQNFEILKSNDRNPLERISGALYPRDPVPDEIILVRFDSPAGIHAYYFKKKSLIMDYQFRNIRNAKLFLRATFGNEGVVGFKKLRSGKKTYWPRIEQSIYSRSHQVRYESPFFQWPKTI